MTCPRCATKWFVAYSEGDCQESDAAEVAALFDIDEMLDSYPLPVRASSREEAARIAKQWADAGANDDIGDIVIERSASARACWLEMLR